jgi:hypothetical protein
MRSAGVMEASMEGLRASNAAFKYHIYGVVDQETTLCARLMRVLQRESFGTGLRIWKVIPMAGAKDAPVAVRPGHET